MAKCVRLLTLIRVLAALSCVTTVGEARAQVGVGRVPVQEARPRLVGGFGQALIGGMQGQPDQLRERLLLEVELMAKVGELSREQAETLLDEGETAIEQHVALVQAAAGKQRLIRRKVVVDGRRHVVLEAFGETPEQAVHRSLMLVLKEISPSAWRKFDADEERLDDIDAACGLSALQREKLLLAGQLDMASLREQLASPPAETSREEDGVQVQRVQVKGGAAMLPLAIFSDTSSSFQKSLRGRLLDDQWQRLAAAERARHAFQRQALVESVVAGFERAAALTADQCHALAAALHDSLAEVEGGGNNWLVAWLRCIAQLPDERLQAMFFDFQWPAARQQQAQLAEVARQFEAQQVSPAVLAPAAAGGGVF